MSESNGTAPAADTDVLTAVPEAAALDATAAVTWPAHAPGREVITCRPCGDRFAGDPAASFTSPVLAAAVTDAAAAAGWQQDEETWTCSVCISGITGPLYGPESEPAAATPAPDTDPIDQSLAILSDFDARVPGWWAETNRTNNTASHKIYLRFGDGFHNVTATFGRKPELHFDAEAAERLHRYEAELAQRRAVMHREVLERIAGLRSDIAPRETGTAVAA